MQEPKNRRAVHFHFFNRLTLEIEEVMLDCRTDRRYLYFCIFDIYFFCLYITIAILNH